MTKRNLSWSGLFSGALLMEAFQRRELRDNLTIKKASGATRGGRTTFIFRDRVGVIATNATEA